MWTHNEWPEIKPALNREKLKRKGLLPLADGGMFGPRVCCYLSSLIFVMKFWKCSQNLARGLEHARDDTDSLDDSDGLLIACRSLYSPSANSSTVKCWAMRRVMLPSVDALEATADSRKTVK